jgi:MFS family permease
LGLGLLTLINLLNYLDRYVVAGVLSDLERDLKVSHSEAGLVQSAFLISYVAISPFAGYLGDRIPRKYLITAGVSIWSLATVASGLAPTYPLLLVARAFIGVGEAGYATVAPALISDLFTKDKRGKMLSVFYAALPIGVALGFAIGGQVAAHWGWRHAFFVAGAPGLGLALLSLVLHEPKRGAQDEGETVQQAVPLGETLRQLAGNKLFWLNNFGMTLLTFSLGGLAVWMPHFFETEHHLTEDKAGTIFGGITLVAGFLGTALGGWAGDVAVRRHAGGYFWISGVGLLIGAPFVVLVGLANDVNMAYLFSLIGILFVFFNTGPLNAALVNCVPAGLRSGAVAVNILCQHLLGDALSPPLIGALADVKGLKVAVAANAIPLVIGGVALVIGARQVTDAPTVKAGPLH